jgi:hypothetical protein
MAKARGLPDSFKLNVSSTITKPVELADYLDEVPPPARPVKAAPPPPPPAAVVVVQEPEPVPPAPLIERVQPVEPPAIARVERRAVPVAEPALFPDRPLRPVVPARPARLKVTVPRKQINMSPETLTMVADLVDFVQTYSVQKDLSAAELFHALVLALFEAREELDLSRVQPRGRWGTPTAAALPIALKNSMQKAIQRYSERQK